jgi:hypothetical protein
MSRKSDEELKTGISPLAGISAQRRVRRSETKSFWDLLNLMFEKPFGWLDTSPWMRTERWMARTYAWSSPTTIRASPL